MVLSQISKKYFKLAVGTIKREGPNRLVCNCPLCGDTKSRLSITAVQDEDGVCGCFNAGCELSDQQLPLMSALELLAPNLVDQYKRERFSTYIDKLKDLDKPSLNEILAEAKRKKEALKNTDKISEKIPEVLPKIDTSKLKVPDIFKEGLMNFKSSKRAMDYIQGRGLEPDDDWLFSEGKFVKFFEQAYYVESFFFIPLWQNGKFSGFYTRSITEKRFSTIIFPKREKYFAVKGLDYNKPCYIFEGILDGMSSGLDNYAAMLSADLPAEFLDELSEPIFCFDNDATGVSKALKYNKEGYKTFVWPDMPNKDLNEILQKGGTKEQNSNMITSNIYQGIQGQIRLNLSKG